MIFVVLARLALGLIFLISGLQDIIHWTASRASLVNALCDWNSHAIFVRSIQCYVTALVPWASFLLAVSLVVQIVGGTMILFGIREKLGAWLLILFLIPSTLLFHSFWFLEGVSKVIEANIFFKNTAILGGLMLVVIHGAKTRLENSSENLC